MEIPLLVEIQLIEAALQVGAQMDARNEYAHQAFDGFFPIWWDGILDGSAKTFQMSLPPPKSHIFFQLDIS